MDKITTISFDADGTLWDFEGVMRHALGCALDELRRLVPAVPDSLSINTLIAIRDQVAEEQKSRGLTHEAIRLEAFKRTLRFINNSDDDLAVHLNTLYLKHRFEDILLFDDVLPTLEALRGGYTMGLLSNGNTYPERCGLGRLLPIRGVCSGLWNPKTRSRRLFEIAIERAGCAKRQLLHVGDSFRNDIIGAKQAGVRSVWLNRQGINNEARQQPDFEISSLRELTKVLENFM